LALTEAGRALLEHAAVIAERLELADAQLRELVHGELPVQIGAVPTALAGLVPAAVNVLRRQRPCPVIVVEDRGWNDAVIEKLLEAIRASAPNEVDEVVHRILKEMR
jgi:DNA-binding transcriptional LysR family regulator